MLLNWREATACRNAVTANSDPFFDETEPGERTAIAICQSCPVQGECLAYAIRTGQPYGVWGGKPQRELRRLIALDLVGRAQVHRGDTCWQEQARRRRFPASVPVDGGGAHG
jgi:WhiB family redox-sensing transcriptional regulator